MMKRIASLLIAALLAGCATPGYVEYTQAVAVQSVASAEARAKTNAAIMAMAMQGDATTKTVAVMLLAMQNNAPSQLPVEPPRDQALQWASIIMPSVTALAGGYFGYRLGVTQSNNQAATTQSSYNTLGTVATGGYASNTLIAGAGLATLAQFKPTPVDWASVIGNLQPNVTTTISNSAGGDAVLGSGVISKPTTTTVTTDNSNRSTNTTAP